MSTIGNNIRRLRESAGMSQDKLASLLGKTPAAVSQYESGATTPRMGVIEDLAQIFKVSKTEIIEETTTYYLANFDSYLTKDEQQLVELYRKMDTRARHDLLSIAASLSPASDSTCEEGVA